MRLTATALLCSARSARMRAAAVAVVRQANAEGGCFARLLKCCSAALCAALPVVTAAPATAESLAVATQNMRLAMEICLRNYPNTQALPQAFDQAGFTLSQIEGEFWEFEAPGVYGGFAIRVKDATCYVQSTDVPLRIAEEMGQNLSESLFPGKVALGPPEQDVNQPVPPCGGYHIFAPRVLLVLNYSAAGNSGECLNDGTSAVLINM